MHRLTGLLFAALLAFSAAPAFAMDILVLRHAEKASGAGSDPGLALAGQERVYATRYRRAIETARPAAEAAGVVVRIYDPSRPDELIAKICALPADSRVLVVGHSNTVPPLVQQLSGLAVEEMPESEYDRWMLVHIDGNGRASLQIDRY
jgi:broad specificity phosphatase PhoE